MSVKAENRNFYSKTTDRAGFAVDVLARFREEIFAAKRVLVKPNIVSHEHYPTTTHPEVLAATLDFLKGRDVAVADGMAVDIVMSHRALVRHPLSLVCESRGAPLHDLHQGGTITLKSPRGYSFTMSRLPRNYDYVISLPVLKSHAICRMTGALKNQFGYVTKSERIKMHSHLKDIHKGIAEVNAMTPASLFIVDAVETLTVTNEARHGGRRAQIGCMLAGKDPVALDAKGLSLLQSVDDRLWGARPEDVPHLRYAIEYGLGDPTGEVVEI